MKKILKWTGILLAVLILVVAGAAFFLRQTALGRLHKQYDVSPAAVLNIPADSLSIAAGEKWVSTLCAGCHADNLAGTAFFNTPDLGNISAPNLTPGGAGKGYTAIDWDRAIRHGVGKDGRPLLIMPAKDFQFMSDEHLAQIIAYLGTLKPVQQEWPAVSTTFMCDVLFQLGAFGDALNAETIDHKKPSHYAPEYAASAEYGNYLVKLGGCRTCHGQQLNGGKDPNPEAPPGPNLTPGGSLATWGADGFVNTMRSGITPLGKEIRGEFMPWKYVGKFDDTQLKAIYAYLMAQPKLEMAAIK